MSIATKRMWLRRWRRIWAFIGFFVLLPFRIIGAIWEYAKESPADFVGAALITAIIGAVVGLGIASSVNESRDAKIAPAAVLQKHADADGCFKFNMPIRIAEWKRPATIKDVRQLVEACEKMKLDTEQIAKQKEALK